MQLSLGIDLGTSNSAIVGSNGVDLRLFKTAEGTDVLPSAIFVDKRGHKFVGARAYGNIAIAPQNVAQGFKRLMGTKTPIRIEAAGLEMSPEECSAEIIRTLVNQAATAMGEIEIEGTIITIPAAFNQMQNESTIRAASIADLHYVGLLQEPIAAAMASMSTSSNKSGQFLIYDLGGGTFDVALVQSIGGAVNIIAHEGINMLGGRDFDRMIVDEFVRPWLLDSFALDANFQSHDQYRRLSAIARHAAEKAKIALSSTENATVFASDEEIRLKDNEGNDIYIAVDLSRRQLERLLHGKIDETISLCRKVIADNGYSNDDIERVVFIGGPSMMPWIRNFVPQQLGVPADLATDPMTAVARGAAIFAESREWSQSGSSSRKPSRITAYSEGPIEIKYDYPLRTSEDRAKIRISPEARIRGDGYRIHLDTREGWASGFMDLNKDLIVEVPVTEKGENLYRITVSDKSGTIVQDACTQISVVRTHASAAGIPATLTLAVKVADVSSGEMKNELDPLVTKGTILPAKGSKKFRAAKSLRGGEEGQIDIEFFQQVDGVPEPHLNLGVGSFRLDAATDMEKGETLRKGDEIVIVWEMDDNGLLTCIVEATAIGRVFDSKNFYTAAAGHQNFAGEDGRLLAASILNDAERDVENAHEILSGSSAAVVEDLRQQLDQQKRGLERSVDADDRRQISEQAREIRQAISRIRHDPKNRATVLKREIADLQEMFDVEVRDEADETITRVFDRSAGTAESALGVNDLETAERAFKEMESVAHRALFRSPKFIIHMFRIMSAEQFLAVDKVKHERLVEEGRRALSGGDIDKVKAIIGAMLENRISIGGGDKTVNLMAGLMKA